MKRKNHTNIFRKLLLLIAVFSFLREAGAQVSGVKNVPGNYATIEAAILDMNTNGIGAGGVTVQISAGYVENIAATLSLTATGTASAPIVFRKNGSGTNPRINAYTGGTGVPGSSDMDGIWRLVGCDYVTIDGIDLAENVANTTNPATMEYGYGLYKKSADDGCQHVTIQNCNISLSTVNNDFSATLLPHEGSTGICVVNAVPFVSSVPVPPSPKGTNSYNAFYQNTITQCNTGISLFGYTDIAPYALSDTLNDIGGNSAATGNSIFNFGGSTGASNRATGINTLAQAGINISYNIINNNNGAGINHTQALYGIFMDATDGIHAICNNNQVSVKSTSLTGDVAGIMVFSKREEEPENSLISMSYNMIEGCENLDANFAGGLYGIYANGVFKDLAIEHNIIRNISLGASAAQLSGIRLNTGSANSLSNAGKNNINDNQVYALLTSGTGNLYGINSRGTAAEYIDRNVIYNLLNQSTVPGNFNVAGISSSGEGFQNTMGEVLQSKRKMISISGNEIYDLHTPAGFLTSDGISGVLTKDRSGMVSDNRIHNLSGQSADVTGVHIKMISGTFILLTTPVLTYDMRVTRNKIYDLSSDAAVTQVSGIAFRNDQSNLYDVKRTSCTIDNNVVGSLYAPSATIDNAVIGIEINKPTDGNAHVYYNTIALDATSAGAVFGSSGIYTVKALPDLFLTRYGVGLGGSIEMKNNLILNTSVPAGTGLTVAYRKSGVIMAGPDHLPSSDHNLFYAGVPDTAHLLLYDEGNSAQTMTQLRAALAISASERPENEFSFSSDVTFANRNGVSPNFLVPDPGIPTRIESAGANITGFETDINGNIRAGNAGYTGTAPSPDIGAYERSMILLDVSAPQIRHHSPGAISHFMPVMLKAEINDISGVDTNLNIPVVYYKYGAGGTYYQSYGTLQSGNAINGVWSFSVDPLNFGTLLTGDSIYYFIGVQDISVQQNFSSFPEGATGTVNSIATYPASLEVLVVKESISGDYLIGASQLPPNYTTISAALNDLSGKVVTGNLNLLLQADYQSANEPAFPIVFAPFKSVDDAYTVTLKPDVHVNAVIEGTSAPDASMIELIDDAANYIIDGSNNGTNSRNLTIRNAQAINTFVVKLSGSAPDRGTRNIQLKNTRIEGGSESKQNAGIGIGGLDIFNAFGATHKGTLISNNQIRNCFAGIVVVGRDKPTDNMIVIEKNTIEGFRAANGQMEMTVGIMVHTADKIRIDQNKISNAKDGIAVEGQLTNSTVSNNVINNVVSGIISNGYVNQSPFYNDSLINNAISDAWQNGIRLIDVGDNIKVYFNSVSMKNGEDIKVSIALELFHKGMGIDIRNNILSSPLLPFSVNRFVVAVSLSDINKYPIVFDHNVFLVDSIQGAPIVFMSPSQGIYTLGELQNKTNTNFNSLLTDPLFNSPSNLVLLPNSPAVGKGVPIPGLDRDVDGNLRSSIAPTAGAYEIAADVSGPLLEYVPMDGASVSLSRTVFVDIRDFSGVDIVANPPRIYYKKTTDKDTFGINNASDSGWKWVEAGNTSSPFQFIIDYSLLSGGGVSIGDNIQYFFVARDVINNISASPAAGFSGTVAAVTSAPVWLETYAINAAPLNGSYTVGSGGIYPDLATASSDINIRGLSGNVSLEIVSSITEPRSVIFREWREFGAGNYTLSIVPSPLNPAGDTIVSSADGPTITIAGADRVIIDGRLNNAGNYLTIINQTSSGNAGNSCITVEGPGATDLTIRNINGSIQRRNGAVIRVAGDANDRISILDNVLIKAFYGIRVGPFTQSAVETSRGLVISGNKIGSDTSASYITQLGITLKGGTPGAVVSDNYIFNIAAYIATGVKGIELLNGHGAVVKNNRIKNISNASTGEAVGIDVTGDSVQILSNDIAGVFNAQSPQYGRASGIFIRDGLAAHIMHNSVNIYGPPLPDGITSGRRSQALGFRTSSSGVIVENNILANSATGTGTVSSYCIYAPNVSFVSIDHNNYDTTGAGPGGIVGMGSKICRSLNDWKAYTKQDTHSLSVASGFTSMSDLMIATAGTPNALESGGKTIAAVSTDRLGKTRPYTTPTFYGGNTAPDIGAYEFDGATDDRLPPVISLVHPPKQSNSLIGQTIEAAITDSGSGVSTGLKPRIYFKRSSDANVWIGNNPGDSGWKWQEATNTASPFSFEIYYSALFGGAAFSKDTIQYFVVAEDQSTHANTGASSIDGFSATSVSNLLSFPAKPSSYVINTLVPLNGIYDVGVSGAYHTITAAVADLHLRGVSGAVTFRLMDASYDVNETFPISIGEVINASLANTVTIMPAPGVKAVISGSASAIFHIAANASFIVINGSNNNTDSKDLAVINTSASSTNVVLMIAGEQVVVKNLIVKGGSNRNEAGIKIIGGNSIKQPVSILNNQIYYVNAGILNDAPASDILIEGNTIGTDTQAFFIRQHGVSIVKAKNVVINRNRIYHINTAETGVQSTGIRLSADILTSTVSNNIVTGVHSEGGQNNSSATGIFVGSKAGSVDSVYNNMVSDIITSNDNSMSAGLYINAPGGRMEIYHNTVYLSGQPSVGNGASRSAALLVSDINGTPQIGFRNNIFSNTMSGVRGGSVHNAVLAEGNSAGRFVSDYNNFYASGTHAVLLTVGTSNQQYHTLADLKRMLGTNANSKNEEVHFVSSTDLHLVAPSNGNAALAGTPVAVTTDIDNTPRSTTYPYMGAHEASIPVPVKMTAFNAFLSGNDVQVKWSTASETNNKGFTIERSVDNKSFEAIGYVKGRGNSAVTSVYNFNDVNAFENKQVNTLYYRLRQHDMNGAESISAVAGVHRMESKEGSALHVYPNPVADVVTITLSQSTTADIEIADLMGRVVKTATITNSETQIDVSSFDAGIYLVRIKGDTPQVIKLIKQN